MRILTVIIAVLCSAHLLASSGNNDPLDSERLERVRQCQAISSPTSRVQCLRNLTPEALKMRLGEQARLLALHRGNQRKCRGDKISPSVCATDKTLSNLEEIFGRRVLEREEKLELVKNCLNFPRAERWNCLYKKIYLRNQFFTNSQREAFDSIYKSHLEWCSGGEYSKDKNRSKVKIDKAWKDCAAERSFKHLQTKYSEDKRCYDNDCDLESSTGSSIY